MTGCDVRVRRPDGSDCDSGERGEIVIKSDGLMRGYWQNDAATREAIRDGFLHTGDIGEIDDAGFVYVVDRLKDMIVSGGENIYSREVEDALSSHPAVLEAAVVGGPDERWGETVVAFVVRRPGEIGQCRGHHGALRQGGRLVQASAGGPICREPAEAAQRQDREVQIARSAMGGEGAHDMNDTSASTIVMERT